MNRNSLILQLKQGGLINLYLRDREAGMLQQRTVDMEQQKEIEINKYIEKLKYYLEQADDAIVQNGDITEIKMVNKRPTAIFDNLNNLLACVQELRIDQGKETPRAICQWKKKQRKSMLMGCRGTYIYSKKVTCEAETTYYTTLNRGKTPI